MESTGGVFLRSTSDCSSRWGPLFQGSNRRAWDRRVRHRLLGRVFAARYSRDSNQQNRTGGNLAPRRHPVMVSSGRQGGQCIPAPRGLTFSLHLLPCLSGCRATLGAHRSQGLYDTVDFLFGVEIMGGEPQRGRRSLLVHIDHRIRTQRGRRVDPLGAQQL